MKLFTADSVRQADAFTILNEPISSIDLMERAATEAYLRILKLIKKEDKILVLVGPGNNGGDGLVVARLLLENRFNVDVIDVGISENYTPDFQINRDRLENMKSSSIEQYRIGSDILSDYTVIVDAMLGSGLSRPIEGMLAQIVHEVNRSEKRVIAIDIPTGLMGENNAENVRENIVKAEYTLTFQFPKLSFLLPENEAFVGQFITLNIGIHEDYIEQTQTQYFLTEKQDLDLQFLKRKSFSHKGTYGHALIYAGSEGKMGASILATEACLRSGIGLTTALLSVSNNFIMQTALPEAMTFIFNEEDQIQIPDLSVFSTIGLGPGIGKTTIALELLTKLLEDFSQPMVFDADAINLIAEHPKLLKKIPKHSIFTPHPKELERLIGKSPDHYTRLFQTAEFAKKFEVYMLIKGAYSVVITPNGTFHFNSTGNPGMATAGSGDVLTGIVTGLLAQGLSPFNALRTGVFVHGLAGDLAKKKKGELSLIASDIVDALGHAFVKLKN
ncbi:MAG: NAD(P)H-hydrate dehydratase [Bacteroidales bacterium]|nr:NAD(P)H-hydrate dehydratase [Bacteroidales bacterium]